MFSFWKRRKTERAAQQGATQTANAGSVRVSVVGSGDAFGSGGRLQTCFHVTGQDATFLIDCGATALIGMRRLGLDPNAVDAIVLSHLHGDHFAGLVWWVMQAQFEGGRTRPLTVVGPIGTEERYRATAELLYPGSTGFKPEFALEFVNFEDGGSVSRDGFDVAAYGVKHPSGSLSAALRFAVDGKVLSFSGDTEWVEALVACAEGADLFICECYGFSGRAYYHMTWETIEPHIRRLTARRVLLTHMNPEMLAKAETIAAQGGVLLAHDGMVLEI